jgi:hypothetical protein
MYKCRFCYTELIRFSCQKLIQSSSTLLSSPPRSVTLGQPIPSPQARVPIIIFKKSINKRQESGLRFAFTEGVLSFTRAPTSLPYFRLFGTVHERSVLVPDLAEKVDAVRSRKERRGDRVHGRVAPTLYYMNPYNSEVCSLVLI